MKTKIVTLLASLSLLALTAPALAASPASVVGAIPPAFANTGYTHQLTAPVYVSGKLIGYVGLACNSKDLCKGYVRSANPIAVPLVDLTSGGTDPTQGLPQGGWQPMAAIGQQLAEWSYGTMTFADGAYYITP